MSKQNILKAIIVEDEKNAQEALLGLLEMCCAEVEVVGVAENVKAAFQLIKEKQPDIVFLDIILGERDGFELLKLFDSSDFEAIITTAHNKYGAEAFEEEATGYLLKPIDPRLLKKVVSKARKNLREGAKDSITIHTVGSRLILKHKDIIYVKGGGAWAHFIRVGNPKITAANNLGFYEKILPISKKRPFKTGFYRSHQTYLINISHVMEINTSDNLVKMSNGDWVNISGVKKQGLLDLFD